MKIPKKTSDNLKNEDDLSNITLQQDCQLSFKFCPLKELAEFINLEIIQIQEKPKGRGCTPEFKMHCMLMYFKGSKLYRTYLAKTYCLLEPRIIRKFVQTVN